MIVNFFSYIKFATIYFSILAFIPQGIAQDDNPEDLLNMSLTELMNIKITVASKTDEDINEAPGIISVISQKEIESFAEDNLGAILNRVVSTSFLSANIFEDNIIDFRGQSFTPYNNHTLFLLNGRPVRDPVSGGLNNTLLTSFPVNIIERIEIIRGPGSVLYGSAAYSGVVNIITKKLDINDVNISLETGYGSQNTYEYSAGIAIKQNDLDLTIGFYNRNSDGHEYVFTDYLGVDSSANFWRKNVGAFASVNYKGFSFNGGILNFRPYSLGGVDNSWSSEWGDKEEHTSFFHDIGYEHKFNEDNKLIVNLTNNRRSWHSDYGKVIEAEDYMSELTWYSSINEDFNVLLGGTFGTEEHSSDYFFNGRTLFGSMYLQTDYKLNDKLKLIGGLQFNKIENVVGNLSPRAGLIANFSNKLGAKVLYGKAFRKAYPLETSFNIPQLLGNPKLNPELINTTEAQIFYKNDEIQLALTGYYSKMSDIIYREPYNPEDWLQYANGPNHEFYGLEFESKFTISEHLFVLASFNYQENEGDDIEMVNPSNETDVQVISNTTLHPNYMAKAGFIYSINRFNLGVYNSYFGKPKSVSDVNPFVNKVNNEPTAYNLLSAKVAYTVSNTENITTKLVVQGQNLLGEKVYYPEFTSRGVNSLLPLMTERMLMMKLKLEF